LFPPARSSLYPNVDFYSGIVLRALGIPVEMYTVLFAMARTVGWVAQVRRGAWAAQGRVLGRQDRRVAPCSLLG
jgi:citrate synthase